ncbi:hypothetical protein Ahy_A04g021171 isoform B [Arachis hypogaea]|uniref:Uncharacterized protein n=1 Tax=Arachis hypogaea TaxID=3818 RepID=A0A445DJP2_ARAHY|nr:hypothetical protein Ahy_A04g021171 isoform B [Arachis hypogaea]
MECKFLWYCTGDTYTYKVNASLEKALQGFEHVYDDIVSGVIDVNELGFLVKHTEETAVYQWQYREEKRGEEFSLGR